MRAGAIASPRSSTDASSQSRSLPLTASGPLPSKKSGHASLPCPRSSVPRHVATSSPHFMPFQQGVGVRGGSEAMGHALRSSLEAMLRPTRARPLWHCPEDGTPAHQRRACRLTCASTPRRRMSRRQRPHLTAGRQRTHGANLRSPRHQTL
jgi:hypothetical protein